MSIYSTSSGFFSKLYIVGHDDQIHRPVANVKQEEYQREHVGGAAVKTQLETNQSRLKHIAIGSDWMKVKYK